MKTLSIRLLAVGWFATILLLVAMSYAKILGHHVYQTTIVWKTNVVEQWVGADSANWSGYVLSTYSNIDNGWVDLSLTIRMRETTNR